MKKILIVDDNPDNVEVIKYKLQRSNQFELEIREAYSGQEAIRMASEEPFDIVLLDVMMPNISGFDVCRQIKEIKKEEFLPIILVTAREDIDSKLKGFKAGADDYIAKPFDLQELEARIKSMLHIKDLQDKLREAYDKLSQTSEKLLKAERLAAVGAVVASVNHEINNPLCAIILNAQLLRMDIEKNSDKTGERLDNIESNVTRIQKITQRIQELKEAGTKEYVSGEQMLDLGD